MKYIYIYSYLISHIYIFRYFNLFICLSNDLFLYSYIHIYTILVLHMKYMNVHHKWRYIDSLGVVAMHFYVAQYKYDGLGSMWLPPPPCGGGWRFWWFSMLHMRVGISVYIYMYIYIYVCIYLSIYLFFYLSIDLSIYLFKTEHTCYIATL